jgi:phosphate/phosphite/phosphonate ABC transporter binding protein
MRSDFEMKKFLTILTLAMLACTAPIRIAPPTSTPFLTPVPPTSTPVPPALGSEKNPLILALLPSPHPSAEMINAGKDLAAFIEARTGYRLVLVTPTSEVRLVEAFHAGNAHIASLSPFGYLFAREDDSATAALGSLRRGELFYSAQIIANRDSGFVPFFDVTRNTNTAEATNALSQFKDKKPCWSDTTSPSGYVIPIGVLNQAGVKLKSGAFLEGQANVVRAVYASDICDFGATYTDARDLPSLEANYPDVLERVTVIWRTPKIIPYENISFSNKLPLEIRRALQRAFIDLILTPEGKETLRIAYGIDELQVVEDATYMEFIKYAKDSGLDLATLLK